MLYLRKICCYLLALIIPLTAFPVAAEVTKGEAYGFRTAFVETTENATTRYQVGAGFVIITTERVEDGALVVTRERHILTEREIVIAPDLSSATMTGLMNGDVLVSVQLTATGKAETEVSHPEPHELIMDGIDGVLVEIYHVRFRPAAGTVTIGGTTHAVNGSITFTTYKIENNDGQEPKPHQPEPPGPKN